MKLSPNTSTPDPEKWPRYESEWRQRTKYTFFPTYVKTDSLHVPWDKYFIACQYNGRACSELHENSTEVNLTSNEVDSNGIFMGDSHWTIDPGRLYGYAENSGDKTDKLETVRKLTNPTVWPKTSPVKIFTSAKYQCFQVCYNS